MNPNNGRYLMMGSECVYEGPLEGLAGKPCLITSMNFGHGARRDRNIILARFAHDGRERVVDIRNLAPKGMEMKNFKAAVKAALDTLLKPLDADSAKEQAVRRLGVAAEIVRIGEADKKKAKTELTKLGIITGDEQSGIVFDSARYVVTATTKAGSSRIEAGALAAALRNENLSEAMQRRIIAAATVSNKAATSFAVESK